MKYEVNIRYYTTGATEAIDVVEAPAGYTAEQYIEDCKRNADEEWCMLLETGDVSIYPVD